MIFDTLSNLKDSFKREPITLNMDETSAKSIINQYNDMKLSADAFIERTGLSDEAMKSYLHTVESGKATFAGCTQHINTTSNSIGLMGVKAKATTVLLGGLKAVTGMLITTLLTMAVGKIIEGLDNLIHKSEKIAEAAEKAKQKIDELKSSFDELESSTNNIKERYAELAQGVDQLTGKNLTLSTDDYNEFLDLSNQLAELFPSLTKNYSENGDAILDLTGDVNSIVGSLDNLIERQQDLINKQMLEEMPNVYDDYKQNVEGYEEEIETLQKKHQIVQDLRNQDYSISDIPLDNKIGMQWELPEISNKDLMDVEAELRNSLSQLEIDMSDIIIETGGGTGEIDPFINLIINEDELKYLNGIEEILGKRLASINNEIQVAKTQLDSEISSFNSYLNIWLSNDPIYKAQTSTMQSTLQQLLFSNDWLKNALEDPSVDEKQWSSVATWMQKKYINAINGINDEKIKEKLTELFTVDLTPENKITLAQELQDYFEKNNINISLGFIWDKENDNSTANLVDRFYASRTKIAAYDPEGYNRLKEVTKDFNEAQMETWLEVTQNAYNADDAIRKYEQSLNGVLNEDYDFFSEENLEDIDEYKNKISDLGSYLSSIDANHKLSAEEMATLNTEYGIVANSVEEYKQAIINLMNETASNSMVMKALAEAIENCNDAAEKEQLQALYDTLKNINTEAQESANSFSNLDTAISTLQSRAELLRDLDESIEEVGYIDSSKFDDILSVYPELEEKVAEFNAGLITSEELFNSMVSAYEMDQENYATLISNKLQDNNEFYNKVVEDIPDWLTDLANSYNIDFSNYKNLQEAKLDIQKKFLQKQAKLSMAQKIISNQTDDDPTNDDQYKFLTDPNYDNFDEKANLIEAKTEYSDILEIINGLDTTITTTLELKTDWKDYGKDKSEDDSDDEEKEEESKTEIDWADQTLKLLQEQVDEAQTTLDDAKGFDNQIEAIDGLNGALETLRDKYDQLSTEYSNRYGENLFQLDDWETIQRNIESGQEIDLTEYSSEEAEIIQEAIDNYNKMIEAKQKSAELTEEMDYNENIGKSIAKQERYEQLLEGTQILLEDESLTADQKKQLLKEQLIYQKSINNELIKQAEYEGNILEAENLRKKNKQLEEQFVSNAWQSYIDQNQNIIDGKTAKLEDDSLSENEINTINSEIKGLTLKDYRYKFRQSIGKLDEGVWDNYIAELKTKYGQEDVDNKKFIKEHLQEIAEYFSYIGMEELYYQYLNYLDDYKNSEYETAKTTRSYYIDDNNNKIANIQSDIDYAGGKGTKEQYKEMKDLHRSNLTYWKEQKTTAKNMLKSIEPGTAEWNYWNSELQEAQQNIDACKQSVKDCNIEILKLPLEDVEKALESIQDQMDDISKQMEDYNTYVSVAETILDKQIKAENDKKEIIQEQIDELEEANELRETNLALQQAEYNLRRAENQRSNKVFVEGQGWTYQSDPEEIQNAREAFDEAVYNKKIYDLNQQIKVHDDEIERLEKIKEKWSEVSSYAKNILDLNKAIAYDSLFINKVLSGDVGLLNDIQNNLLGLSFAQESLEDDQEYYQDIQDLINDTVESYENEEISFKDAKAQIMNSIKTYYPEVFEKYSEESKKIEELVNQKLEEAGITEETSKDIDKAVEESNEKMIESYTDFEENLKEIFNNLNIIVQSFAINTQQMVDSVNSSLASLMAARNKVTGLTGVNIGAGIAAGALAGITKLVKIKKAGKSHSGMELGYLGESSNSKDKDAFRYIALDEMDNTELLRLVQKGEAILTPSQVTNVMDNFRNLAQVKIPNIIPTSTQTNQSVNFTGDIIINNPVGDTSSLAKAIKQNLGNNVLQELYKK